MKEEIKSTIEYPKLELGDQTYEIKFTRGLLFRLDKAGIQFNATINKTRSTMGLANLIEVLHMAINFPGTTEELAELAFDKRDEIMTVLVEAWGKVVLPSLQARVAAQAAAQQGTAETNPKPETVQ